MLQRQASLYRFKRFVIVGVVNTFVSFSVYLALTPFIGYLWAYVAAFVTGVAISFFLSTRWVFKTHSSIARATFFPLVYAPQLLIGSFILNIFVEMFGIHRNLALLLVIALTLPINFLLAKTLLRDVGKEILKKP